MRDTARERTDRLQSLTMAQLLLQLLAPTFGNFHFLDLGLQPVIHAHQLTTHVLEVRGQLMQLANAGADAERLSVVARGDGPGNIPQADELGATTDNSG